MRALLLLGLLLASTIGPAAAATIQSLGPVDGINIIAIHGEITEWDAAQFDLVAKSIDEPATVILSSPGGLVVDGLNIGTEIRRLGYGTLVPSGETCASVCGLIWLAGTPRMLTPSSKVGFHAAYRPDGSESGQANAIVGAYLTHLGFSYDAIAFLTESSPDGMEWLHPSDAARVGIFYSLIRPTPDDSQAFIPGSEPQEPPQAPPPAPDSTSTPAAPAPAPAPARSPAEQQAIATVLNANAYWSQGGADVEGLAQYYAPTVTFYGTSIPREKVMAEKRKFSARWPIRHYTVDQSTLFVSCDASGNGGDPVCAVSGVVDWDCASPERGAHSVGRATFSVRITGGAIVSESGTVMTAHNEPIEQQQAATTVAYGQGRQARVDWEQWLNGLPESPFKDGVLYWARHRSDKPQPGCSGDQSGDWTAGCLAARIRLGPIDQRRTTEKDFWLGCNSL